MEVQIHLLEQEAYSAVLRAFKAQSDALTWVSSLVSSVSSILSLYSPAMKIYLVYFTYVFIRRRKV